MRTAVQEWLIERRENQAVRKRLEELEVVRMHRQDLLDRRGGQPLEIDVPALIEQVRQERNDELLASANGGVTGAGD